MGTSESQMQQQIVNNTEFQKYLKQICFKVPKSGLNKNYFDNVLENLNQFKVIQIGSTPLGDRLYDVLNAKNQNKVTSDILYQFLTDLYTNRESRCLYTFQAYCLEGKNIQKQVMERNFIAMVVESWERAFTVLVEQLPENKKKQDGDLIENWSKSQQQKEIVKKAAQACFKNLSKSLNNQAEYLAFKNWICSESQDKIVAKYDGNVVVIPLTLYKFVQ
ncbi:unnamed protein product [Paramecium pentaurelia]|uniref:Uncharacterized protein n=1 Tax=Paramecium pentaurelia TaxID=43138 RepID=A0A8S1SZS2_9CILI|nr:unnamed protein product [Paramecium pentaurelia]